MLHVDMRSLFFRDAVAAVRAGCIQGYANLGKIKLSAGWYSSSLAGSCGADLSHHLSHSLSHRTPCNVPEHTPTISNNQQHTLQPVRTDSCRVLESELLEN